MSISTDDELIVQLLDELVACVRSGRPAPIDDMCAQHPELASRLRDLFAAMCMMEQHKPPKSTDAPIHSEVPLRPIGDYELLREIGRGGMGVVYEARQESLGRKVALKIMSPGLIASPSAVERFRREARAAAQLHHTNIVPVFDVGDDNGTHYYTMQFIDGHGLDRLMSELRLLRMEADSGVTSGTGSSSSLTKSSRYREVARTGLQLAEALHHAHEHGTIHRDIKPSNILIDDSGTAWITDFGLARSDDQSSDSNEGSLTLTGQIVGTLRYLAPERLNGQHTASGDVYSLGATLYEMLALQPMFEESDRIQILDRIRHGQHPSLKKLVPGVPRDLETIIDKATMADSSLRYKDARYLADDLRLFLLDRPIRARRAWFFEKVIRWCQRNRSLAAALAIVVSLLLVLVVGRLIYPELSERHERTVALLERTEAAEQESRAFARLRAVSRYRQTGLAGLKDHLQLIELDPSSLNLPARQELRNEWLSCLARTDWSFTRSIPCGSEIATLDQSGLLLAEVLDNQQLRIRSVSGNHQDWISNPLGLNIKSLWFSRGGKYVLLTNNLDYWQIVSAEGRVIFPHPQAALGCDISDATDQAAFFHNLPIIHMASLKAEHYGQNSTVLEVAAPSKNVRYSQDGSSIAVLDSNPARKLSIYNCIDGRLSGQCSAVGASTLAWSPNGELLALPDDSGAINIRETKNFSVVTTLRGSDVITLMDWHPDGNTLLSTGWSGQTTLWSAWTGKKLVRSNDRFEAISFSRDGVRIGWRRQPGHIQIAELSRGCVKDLPWDSLKQTNLPGTVIIHPNGRLAAGCSQRRLQLFDLESLSALGSIKVEGALTAAFSESGDTLTIISATSAIRWLVTSSTNGQATEVQLEELSRIEIPPIWNGILRDNGLTAIVRTMAAGNRLTEIQLTDGRIIRQFGDSAGDMDIYRPGQSRFVLRRSWHSNMVEIFDIDSCEKLGSVNAGVNSTPSASSDSRNFLTSVSQQLQFWNTDTWKTEGVIQLDTPVVGAVGTFHPTEPLLAIQLMPGRLGLINPEAREIVARIDDGDEMWVNGSQFSRDGRFLIEMIKQPGSLRVWDFAAMRRELSKRGLSWDADPMRPETVPPVERDVPLKMVVTGIADVKVEISLEQQITAARSVLAASPNDSRAQNALAWQLLMAPAEFRSDAEALELARKSAASDPNNAAVRNTLGLACFRAGLFAEAEQELLKNQDTSEKSQLTLDLIILSMSALQREQPSDSQSFYVWAQQNLVDHPPQYIPLSQEILKLFEEHRELARTMRIP